MDELKMLQFFCSIMEQKAFDLKEEFPKGSKKYNHYRDMSYRYQWMQGIIKEYRVQRQCFSTLDYEE